MKSDFINRMSTAFGEGSKFFRLGAVVVSKLTTRLSDLYEHHLCEDGLQPRKRRSPLAVCDELDSDLDRIKSWADRIGNCGNQKKRNRRLSGTIKKINRLQQIIKAKCPKKVNRKARGKKV